MIAHDKEAMQHSEQPFVELDRARQAIEGMRQARSLEDLEEYWKEFLRRIERVWNKSVSHYGKSPKWDNWHGKFVRLRRTDPLIAYFVNARGADEHTVGEITERDHGKLDIKIGPSGTAFIERMEIRNGVLTELRGTGLVLEFEPARVKLLPVKNRGVVRPVPTEHLSQPINSVDLLDIAEKGITFYANFLREAEAFFIKPGPAKS